MDIALRKPCDNCGESHGRVKRVGLQDTVRCVECGKFQYNAPRTETGERKVSLSSVHNAIKPKKRARIFERAGGRCEAPGCGRSELLTVGHIVSVKVGLELGYDEVLLNDDENLMAMCATCNAGWGDRPMPLGLALRVLEARVTWRDNQ